MDEISRIKIRDIPESLIFIVTFLFDDKLICTSGIQSLQMKKNKLPPSQHEIPALLRWNIDHPGITDENPKFNPKK